VGAVLRGRSRPCDRAGGDRAARRDAGALRRPRHRSGRPAVALNAISIRLPHRGWLFDLDGTVYLGEALLPGAERVIAALRAADRRVVFLSNKPLHTRADYAAKLSRLGIAAAAEDVINSSIVLARHLRTLDPGAPVFVIGEPPLLAELAAHGFAVRPDHRVRWVVIAFDRTFDYAKLNVALQAVRQGARLIATNPDRTCPTEDGEIPDCAGMIAAVEAVTGHTVEVIVGKPSPIILEVALASLGVAAADAVIVGDRIETDIVMGKQRGLATVLVLSGVTRADDPRIAEVRPDLVLPGIADLVMLP
jgi:phosphoglycolate/pyridoxal phosphate phosphatase family enzyme